MDKHATTAGLFESYVAQRIADGELREGQPAESHRSMARTWILPNLPEKVAAITKADVRKIPTAMREGGRLQSVPQCRALCRGAFTYALERDLITRDPMVGVTWPRVTCPEKVVPTTNEVK